MKRKIPWFWRRQVSCPDCGYIYHNDECKLKHIFTAPVDCPRCGIHYTNEEFWDLQHDKYSTQADV